MAEKSTYDPNDPTTWPPERYQPIVPAPDPLRNCTECGMWLQEGESHAHEQGQNS